jgi:hypothetical protein
MKASTGPVVAGPGRDAGKPMTAWCADSRVKRVGKGYEVRANGTTYSVLPSDALGWGIYVGHRARMASLPGGRPAVGYATADDAIGALLGGR